jgi:hypothetical protein
MRGVERDQIGGRQAKAQKLRCILNAHGAIDAVGDGTEEFDKVRTTCRRSRRLQDQP